MSLPAARVESARPPESAARHLVRRVPTARGEEAARAVLARLPGQRWDAADSVWIVDALGRLEGRVPLVRLLTVAPERPVREGMEEPPPRVHPETDQEEAAARAIRHRLESVPVVDRDGVLLGVVTAPVLLEILRREHVEDLHRLAGIQRETEQARHALEDPPARRARHRLPWLLVGLAGAMLSAWLMAGFEATLHEQVAIAFFVPAIVYLADAIGTQTETIAVRFLSLSRRSFAGLLVGELRTGLLIGAVLSALALPLAALAVGDLRLAAAVALSLLVAGGLATAIGVLLPWALARAGADPAFGSGPVATIVQDLLSLLVYLSIATRLVA
jgi:magnesium transporter